MSFLDFFRNARQSIVRTFNQWREFGTFTARFSAFGADIYQSDIIRSAIRPISEHTSKAHAVCNNFPEIARILNERPNLYMNGKDFLTKVRNKLELNNTAFIFIQRDLKGHGSGFYPIPYDSFEALEYKNGLFIRFDFSGRADPLILPWQDLAVLRKDYNKSDIAGDKNDAILNTLELINTSNQGIANAVKATANLRGILKSTKAMLSDEDIKRQKDRFVDDYLNLENGSGIASLDATQEFTPITMSPQITNWQTLKEFREDVYRYYGINDSIITSNYTEEQMEAFYDSRIEPFLVALSLELTSKVFTERERGFGASIEYESNRIQFASTSTKLGMVQLVDRALMTPNEYRRMFNMPPYEGGDEFVLRLDTGKTGKETSDEEDR